MSTSAQKAELQRDTVLQFDRKCSASRDYLMLAQEVLSRLKVKPVTKTKGEGTRVVTENVIEEPAQVG
jgi:nitrogenase subunit NifH